MPHAEREVQDDLGALGNPARDEGCHTVRRSVARALFDSMVGDSGYDAAPRTVSPRCKTSPALRQRSIWASPRSERVLTRCSAADVSCLP